MMETKAEAEKKKEEAKSWAVATRLKARTGGGLVGDVVAGVARKATKGIAGTAGKAGSQPLLADGGQSEVDME